MEKKSFQKDRSVLRSLREETDAEDAARVRRYEDNIRGRMEADIRRIASIRDARERHKETYCAVQRWLEDGRVDAARRLAWKEPDLTQRAPLFLCIAMASRDPKDLTVVRRDASFLLKQKEIGTEDLAMLVDLFLGIHELDVTEKNSVRDIRSAIDVVHRLHERGEYVHASHAWYEIAKASRRIDHCISAFRIAFEIEDEDEVEIHLSSLVDLIREHGKRKDFDYAEAMLAILGEFHEMRARRIRAHLTDLDRCALLSELLEIRGFSAS